MGMFVTGFWIKWGRLQPQNCRTIRRQLKHKTKTQFPIKRSTHWTRKEGRLLLNQFRCTLRSVLGDKPNLALIPLDRIVLGCVTVRGIGSKCGRRQTGWSAAGPERRRWCEWLKTPFGEVLEMEIKRKKWSLWWWKRIVDWMEIEGDMDSQSRIWLTGEERTCGAWMLHTKRGWWALNWLIWHTNNGENDLQRCRFLLK